MTLVVNDLSAGYGQLTALRNISLSVEAGEILAIIGANGAGKSTLLKTIAGQLTALTGSVVVDGDDVTSLPASARARRGILMVPEGRRLFPSLTVKENLQLGMSTGRKGHWDLDTVCELFPLVAERLNRVAGQMSGGEQQATAIARALVGNPEVLMLDEISLGLAPAIVVEFYDRLGEITKRGTTVLLVEQDVKRALSVADQVHCLLEGQTSLAGRNLDVAEISAAYFGTGHR
jgi:branched-chain amino acid transport system ATP-binding protein